jgi:hypothetical protein
VQASLDMRTLIFTSGITSLILFLCMLYIRQKQRTYEGFFYWIFAALSNAAGMLLVSQRDILPDFLTIVTGNTLLIFSIMFINLGLNRFAGMRPRFKFYLVLIFLFIAFYSYFTYAVPSFKYRFIVFSLFQMLLCVVMIIIVRRDLPRVIPQRNYVLFWFLVLAAAWPLFRIIASFFESKTATDLMKAGFPHQLTYLGGIAAYIILMVALIIINAQRVEQEMIDAKNEIKMLTGLIPICANCKKIRDDQGSCNQLEAYLSEHADVKFTHGLCPECMQIISSVKST